MDPQNQNAGQPYQAGQPDPTQQVPPQQGQGSPYPTVPSASASLPIPQPKKSGPPLILFIIPIVLLVIGLVFTGVYAMNIAAERDDYKNNVDEKIEVAVEEAKAEQKEELEAEFIEREKSPFRRYRAPAEMGGIRIDYPKTWAAHVNEQGKGKTELEGYMHPSFVPGTDSGTSFALKMEVIAKPYDKELSGYQSKAKRGQVRISPYSLPKVPSVLGARVDGEVERDFRGSAVLFPLRDKTIRITTLSPSFVGDFNNIILPNLSFTP